MAKRKDVRLGLTKLTRKPKDVSQKEWNSFKKARARAAKASKRPHPFAEAHRRLEANRKKREALKKKK